MILPRIFVVMGDPGRDCGASQPICYFFDEGEADDYAREKNEAPNSMYYHRVEEVKHGAA